MPMKTLTICERDWNFNTVVLWVWRKQEAMLWYLVMYMFMVLPMEVFVFLTPGPSQAYHCTNEGTEGREEKGCLWNHNLGLRGTIHVGTAVWPHSEAQSTHTPSQETHPNLFIFLSDHRHRNSLNVSSPVRNMNLSPGILLAQSVYRMGWNVWSTGVWVNRPHTGS